MAKINWKVRIKNKTFWLTVIPASLLVIQAVAGALGFELNVTEAQGNLITIVNAVFALLTILGVVTDPTTVGISDSQQALTYTEPKEDQNA